MAEADRAGRPAGARPAGAENEADAAKAVQAMFDQVAPGYDRLNHLLSLNIDRWWWWRTARRFRAVLRQPRARVLDLCCGTGDMTLALLRHRPQAGVPVLAADFSHAMLVRGAHKLAHSNAVCFEADAMELPLAAGSVDLLVTAFGFRNLRNYAEALREFYRVLAPGGTLGILDFAEPGGLLGRLYAVYFRRVLPAIAKRFSGAPSAYVYLPASVAGFPAPTALQRMMIEAGYQDAQWTAYSFGIAGLYVARKPG